MSAKQEEYEMTEEEYKNSIEHVFFGEDSSDNEDAPPVEENKGRGKRVTIRIEDNQYYSPVIEDRPLPRRWSRCSRICGCLVPRSIRGVKCFFLSFVVGVCFVAWLLSHLLQKFFASEVIYYFRLNLLKTLLREKRSFEEFLEIDREILKDVDWDQVDEYEF